MKKIIFKIFIISCFVNSLVPSHLDKQKEKKSISEYYQYKDPGLYSQTSVRVLNNDFRRSIKTIISDLKSKQLSNKNNSYSKNVSSPGKSQRQEVDDLFS
ncbi:MAG: hypothetical protein ACXWL2_01845 [Candidatus Chromulinivorax sp.]